MKIGFACQHCASHLVADSALAGRVGRCRSCGRRVIVPDAPGKPGAPRSAVPARPARSPPSPPRSSAAPKGHAPSAAVDTAAGYALRPVTPERVPALEAPAWQEDDFQVVFPSPPAPGSLRTATHEPSALFRGYRSIFSLLVKATTWISETSYAVSLVLLMLSVAGGMIGRHALATMGVKAIVALNLVGLAGDVASLVNLSFRKDPVRGVLFLVPPCTLYYLWTDWRRYRDTVGRMRIPALTLVVVGMAYLFLPWLSGGSGKDGSVVASAERVVGDLEEKLGGRRGDIERRLKEARSWLREEAFPDHPSSTPGAPGAEPPAPDGGD